MHLESERAFRLGHIQTLDGVRGLALIIVVLAHTNPQVFPGGNIGVDLFFVLSGFLITSILLNEKNKTGAINLPRFYMRRACRLLPALFALVVFVLLYASVTESGEKLARTFWDAFGVSFYFWNWILAWAGDNFNSHQHMFTHLWSLSIEEQFYLCWPALLLIIFASRSAKNAFLIAMAVLISWPTIWRMALWEKGPSLWLYFRTDLRIDSLMFGATASWLLTQGVIPLEKMKSPIIAWSGVLALIVLLILARFNLLSNGFLYMGGYTPILFLAALLIAIAATYPPAPLRIFLEIGLLRWIGRISYGLYLWHVPMFQLSLKYFPNDLWLQNAFAITATLAVSTISFYWLEQPFLNLKNTLRSP